MLLEEDGVKCLILLVCFRLTLLNDRKFLPKLIHLQSLISITNLPLKHIFHRRLNILNIPPMRIQLIALKNRLLLQNRRHICPIIVQRLLRIQKLLPRSFIMQFICRWNFHNFRRAHQGLDEFVSVGLLVVDDVEVLVDGAGDGHFVVDYAEVFVADRLVYYVLEEVAEALDLLKTLLLDLFVFVVLNIWLLFIFIWRLYSI